MPVYDYECQSCLLVTENLETISLADCSALTECPRCGGEVKRLIGSFQVPDWCQDSKMSDGEKFLHVRQMKDLEKAHAAGTLRDYKRGHKTPCDMIPAFDK